MTLHKLNITIISQYHNSMNKLVHYKAAIIHFIYISCFVCRNLKRIVVFTFSVLTSFHNSELA